MLMFLTGNADKALLFGDQTGDNASFDSYPCMRVTAMSALITMLLAANQGHLIKHIIDDQGILVITLPYWPGSS